MGFVCSMSESKKIHKRNEENKINTQSKINNTSNSFRKNIIIDENFQVNILNSSQKKENEKNNIENNNIIEIALEYHNIYRTHNGLGILVINSELCELAQNYAEKCAETENMEHFPYLFNGNIITQNIKELNNEKIDISKICKEWYGELNNNNQQQNDNSIFSAIEARHMLSKEAKEVGFGLSTSPNGKSYFVAFYYPAGNI